MTKTPSAENATEPSSSRKSWMMSVVPAVGLGLLALVFWGRPLSSPIVFNNLENPASVIILPISSTLIVGQNSTSMTMRGRLTVFNPQIIPSPAAGIVSRLLVEPGQMVQAGDVIAMISNQATPAVEKKRITLQQQAESAQEEAARQQSILEGKLAQEKVLLKAARERVDAASAQLASSRDLLRRLGNGEKIPRSQIADTPADGHQSSQPDAALAQAKQKAESTAKIATQKWQHLHVLLTRKLAAQSNGENTNSIDIVTQDQIDAARNEANAAQAAADKARLEAFKQNQNSPTSNSSKSTFITQADASRIAKAALAESNAALAQVASIQEQIQRYQTPVKSATSNFESATSNLENVQRQLYDNPPKVPMTPVIANAGGMVQTLVTLATSVSRGDEIATLTAPNLLGLNLPDGSNSWQTLALNTKFTVDVLPSGDGSQPVSTDGRLIAITPPARSGKPPVLHVQVFNPAVTSKTVNAENNLPPTKQPPQQRAFSPGMIAICHIPRISAGIKIPRRALQKIAKAQYQVAVLAPDISHPQHFRVKWKNVVFHKDDGKSADILITSGIAAGDRIALQPDLLYPLNTAKGTPVIVQLRNK